MGWATGVEPGCSASRCCLTIASEGRETWAALSLRGAFFVLGFEVGVELALGFGGGVL